MQIYWQIAHIAAQIQSWDSLIVILTVDTILSLSLTHTDTCC